MTDTMLIERARQGDAEAFAQLVDPLTLRLVLLIRHVGRDVLGPDADDEDVMQTVLSRAWKLLPSFEPQGDESFYRWLVALARGAIADRRKYIGAKGRDTVRHLESAFEGSSSAGTPPRHLSTSISRIASRREEQRRAADALAGLPEHYRDVVAPHLLEARSLRDIAASLGVTANAAWERLHRGLALMRAQLSK